MLLTVTGPTRLTADLRAIRHIGYAGTFVLEGRSGQRPGLTPFRPRSTPTP